MAPFCNAFTKPSSTTTPPPAELIGQAAGGAKYPISEDLSLIIAD